ncbi:uncharacterized protein MELLADRAFT_104630 [Melampsora larici-populina 98AG31]|uniref:Uncharacterized protein n=1 Tax=Melampsora larici-populina (strain 98AG31 / pathotype 3-4-7) TaxID=747676 RepID=F4RFD0_MELLP|nr:uncharacterized protein MELLADRAFT_104630 [Melampsora larici-populina 98AG31]EGG08794.1 hypothetical protein MELLADRAFT_104630 [Melampsora larici-populina 98AG31]
MFKLIIKNPLLTLFIKLNVGLNLIPYSDKFSSSSPNDNSPLFFVSQSDFSPSEEIDWKVSKDSHSKAKEEERKAKEPVCNKGITQMKTAGKKAEEVAQLAEFQAKGEEEVGQILRKRREQQRTIEADMEIARGHSW